MHLSKASQDLKKDLELINYPPSDWRKEMTESFPDIYDVVIIGAGMAGLTAGAALFKEGIFHIRIFDQNLIGEEGPWITYARMKTLRSLKAISGPALDIPHLTFQAWYESLFGTVSWQELGKIPNRLWMDYLNWYRDIMQLPVENQSTLMDIIPNQEGFKLHFQKEGQTFIVNTRKVVLATGRGGFGGSIIPSFIKNLPKSLYAHTIDSIPFTDLKNCRIGIIGAGSSSFDAAAVALGTGTKSVDILMRRKHLPNINKFASTTYKGFSLGYFKLSDQKRLALMQAGFSVGSPPPIETLKRVQEHDNLRLLANTHILDVQYHENKILIRTNQGSYTYDFIILGTGFRIDGNQQTELRHVIDQISLWKDRIPQKIMKNYPGMELFPYLGPSFEFLPKIANSAPYLKNLHCFNYAATLSHGLVSSDIPAISIGATRLAQGIAADFFDQNSDQYLALLQNYQEEDFQLKDYFFNE